MDRFDWLELESGNTPRPVDYGLKQAPNDGPSFYRAARRMRESGHFKSASECYQKSIGFDDANYGARVELIDTLVRAHQLELAEEKAKEAVEAYGLVRQFYASRALVFAHRGNLSDAFGHSDVSLEEERNWYCVAVRAELLLKSSRDNRVLATELLEEAVDLATDRWEPHFIAGTILLDCGWPPLAAGHFSEAIHCNPRAVVGWISLGDCFQALRLYDQALFYFQKAIELESNHEVALSRERECAPRLFGLTRMFRTVDLRARWDQAYDDLRNE